MARNDGANGGRMASSKPVARVMVSIVPLFVLYYFSIVSLLLSVFLGSVGCEFVPLVPMSSLVNSAGPAFSVISRIWRESLGAGALIHSIFP